MVRAPVMTNTVGPKANGLVVSFSAAVMVCPATAELKSMVSAPPRLLAPSMAARSVGPV
jgi:hypothetical protein